MASLGIPIVDSKSTLGYSKANSITKTPQAGKGSLAQANSNACLQVDFIQHQELNRTDQPTRVIQIWYIADLEHRGLEPHYQQVSRDELPVYQMGDATVYSLIGEDSPMEQHMTGRLTAIHVPEHGETTLKLPNVG